MAVPAILGLPAQEGNGDNGQVKRGSMATQRAARDLALLGGNVCPARARRMKGALPLY